MPEPLDPETVRRFPKVSLHDHLDGGLRPSTLLDLAAAKGRPLPADDPDGVASWIVRQCAGSLGDYLAVSDLVVELLAGDAEALRRVAREFAHDLADDGVIYAEVRWAPEEVATFGLSPEAAVQAVAEGLRQGVAEVEADGGSLRAEQILCALRTGHRALEIAELALSWRGRGVVGFDLAGAEDGFPPSLHSEALRLLIREQMPVTIHAGEAAGITSIRSALDDGRALRLGHGVRVVEDIRDDGTLGEVAQKVRDRGVALEVCPTSNIQTRAVGSAMWQHPFERLLRKGFALTVSPDNRLLSGTTVTGELRALSGAFGYDMGDIARFQLTAAHSAFLPLADRLNLRETIQSSYFQND